MRRSFWTSDRGSTIPLILGFFVLALLAVAGSVALGAAFVQQRDVQDACDAAAAAAAGSAAELRDSADSADSAGNLRFADDAVAASIRDYVARDPDRSLRIRATLSADRTRVTMQCTDERRLAFGATFGVPVITHTATSTARAGVRG